AAARRRLVNARAAAQERAAMVGREVAERRVRQARQRLVRKRWTARRIVDDLPVPLPGQSLHVRNVGAFANSLEQLEQCVLALAARGVIDVRRVDGGLGGERRG